MKILAVHAGGFPRIGDTREQQRLRVAQEAHDRGGLSGEKLAEVQGDMVREVLSVQARAGLDLVSDGQVRWPDPVSHIMGKLEGVRIGGLLRYFDTNTYFRQPLASGPVSAPGSLVADEYRFARAISARPVTATLTGPFTLSRLSIPGGPYHESNDLMKALVPVIAGEVGQLASAGAGHIIIEEHFLCQEPGEILRVEDALEIIGGRKGSAKIWIRFSFGDCSPLYGALQKLPVDGLILDFTYSPRLAEAVASSGSELPIGLGLVDARNTRLESPLKTAREAERLLKRMHGGEAWIMTSNGVDFLPRTRATEKLALLAKVRDLVTGRGRRGSVSGMRVRAQASRKAAKIRRRAGSKARTHAKKSARRRGRGRP